MLRQDGSAEPAESNRCVPKAARRVLLENLVRWRDFYHLCHRHGGLVRHRVRCAPTAQPHLVQPSLCGCVLVTVRRARRHVHVHTQEQPAFSGHVQGRNDHCHGTPLSAIAVCLQGCPMPELGRELWRNKKTKTAQRFSVSRCHPVYGTHQASLLGTAWQLIRMANSFPAAQYGATCCCMFKPPLVQAY